MPYITIWLHFVWSTKNRAPYLVDEIRGKIISHIKANGKLKGIQIDHINGYLDHLHALVLLKATQSPADIAKYIKGESSRWINENDLLGCRFEWQDDYYCVSIDSSHLENLRTYIRNQVRHHKKNEYKGGMD